MKYSHIELIPSILKPSRPSQYDGESFTVLEYVSKTATKMNEVIKQFNAFVDEVNAYCTDFVKLTGKDYDLFQRTIEQKFQDFIGVIELKYKAQDKIITDAVTYMKDNLGAYVTQIIDAMSESGELDETILNAVGDLQTQFDTTVKTVNDFITQQTTAYNDFVATQTENYNEFASAQTEAVNSAIADMDDARVTLTTEATEAINAANEATADLSDAINALNLAVVDIDGMYPDTSIEATDYDGGKP